MDKESVQPAVVGSGDVTDIWLKKFEADILTPLHFREYWAANVPVYFSPKPNSDCLNLVYDEDGARKVLFAPLERFITNNEDPQKVFEELRNTDKPPALCGRVFKQGEPTYSCRDCGLDPTCVLCIDCFKNSAHKNHRYKMSMSGGGGYCDCGDEEAWRSDAYCEIHYKGKSQMGEETSPVDRMPGALAARVQFVTEVILHYCYQLLTWEHAVNLPKDLQLPLSVTDDLFDMYSTMLFNDEVHTYEQVIQTLGRAIECSQKEAIDYATTIDREGRSIVKCAGFMVCNQVRQVIERITSRHGSKPLKVVVMHTVVIAHQNFAMRLLSWLQGILGHCEAFRLIFSTVMTQPVANDSPILEAVMLADTQLWKIARSQWHQLFISGMLMDQQCKKTFAKTFTRNYPVIMKDFIADDHEHSVSVTSLSVQIFTVPTVAHSLIAEDDGISILLRTFLSECERNRNPDGKLAFQRNQNAGFRRAQYVLFDLKYLLTVKPQVWSDTMRKNFLHGVHSLLTLLGWMQGMDPVVRQVGHHLEFEAEWETGINLQLKLAPVITLALEWCGSDRVVLVKALRVALKMLENIQGHMQEVTRTVAGHSTSTVDYDVSSMPVTIHLPLTRFVTGLLLHLHKYNLSFDSPEFLIRNKPTPEQLMELPLRTQVMLAQFRAGMWRRNGYSLLNQIYYYHNVRLRDEMYDGDILMLQVAASLIDNNDFLMHLINKYGLLPWVLGPPSSSPPKYEDDYSLQTITTAEEFLGLILTLVSERYFPGVGKVVATDKVKKEVIQLLCIEPMPHSQLNKMLPRDPNGETGMEAIINEVALFKKPQGSTVGKYELKPELYKEFNPFFYHYTREEQSRAEEVQLKRRKQAGEEECCPPPVPPDFQTNFAPLTGLLECDVMLHVVGLVLQTATQPNSTSFSETLFEKTLQLIGLALHEEHRKRQIKREDTSTYFTSRAEARSVFHLLEQCFSAPRTESHRDLLKWTVRKFKHVRKLQAASEAGPSEGEPCIDTPPSEASRRERKRNAELAAARRARIMAQMSTLQKNFMREHADLFKEVEAEDAAGEENDTSDDIALVSLGNPKRGRTSSSPVYTCILCLENQEVGYSGRTLVLAAFVQRSTVLSKDRRHRLENGEEYDPLLIPWDLFTGPNISSCGHMMHSDCWQKFFDTVVAKERRRPLRYGRHTSFDVDKHEYLCPLCECLSNTVVPLVPHISSLCDEERILSSQVGLDTWLAGVRQAVDKIQVERFKDPSADEDDKFVCRYSPAPLVDILQGFPPEEREQFANLFTLSNLRSFASSRSDGVQANFAESLVEMMKLFSQAVYTVGLDLNPHSEDDRVPLTCWWSVGQTIHVLEGLLRDQEKSLLGDFSSRQSHCLEAVVHFATASLRVFDGRTVRSHCIRLLRYLLLTEDYTTNQQCVLEVDAFCLLVHLCLSIPLLFESGEGGNAPCVLPLGGSLDRHILSVLYIFHAVQILLRFDGVGLEESMELDVSEEDDEQFVEEECIAQLYTDLLTAAGVDRGQTRPSGRQLKSRLNEGVRPFLRCCSIFFRYLTDVPAPSELTRPCDFEHEALCHYLSLPVQINEMLRLSPQLRHLALSWARHPRVPLALASSVDGSTVRKYPESVNQLVPLPHDYSELINSVSLFTCPTSDGEDSRSPALCLICGELLCSQSYCCQKELDGTMVGACTYHAHFCGADVGIFLRIRDCKVLLLSGKTKGCYMPPPYVDEYGETDQGLLRGNPLHLCQDRYKELHRLWLSHRIPEQISHELEQSTNLAATNWQML